MEQKKRIRLGCIGGGMIMNVAHVPAYVELREEMIVTGIYCPQKETAEETRENYLSQMARAGAEVDWEVRVCASFEELLERVDAIDIGTPTRWHAWYAERALAAGVHAMSEKPIARNYWEAKHLEEAAQTSGAIYQLNDDNVFLPRYQHIKNVLASGAIGEVTQLLLTRGSPSSDRNDWFFDPVSGGGAILDYGSHAVIGAWFLLGFDKRPRRVRAIDIRVKDRTRFIRGRLRDIETDDDAHFKVFFEDPGNGDMIPAVLEATWSWPDFGENSSDTHGHIRVDGTEGWLTSQFDENDQEYLVVHRFAAGERRIPIQSYRSETLSFRDEIWNFIRSIQQGEQSMIDARVGTVTAQIITGAQISQLQGRRMVELEEVGPYCQGFDDGSGDLLKMGDSIALELTRPYRLEG